MSVLSSISYPILLDGGLSNELERLGYRLYTSLWTAQLINEAPEAIVNAHLSYLKAGARCILTASYQASIPGLIKMGYSEEKAKETIIKSVTLAQKAVELYKREFPQTNHILIGGSLGPYGAFLADGSEYDGKYGVKDHILREFHQNKILLLDNSEADVLVFETIPSYQEASVLAELIKDVQTPVWVSFSCRDDMHINDGTPISNCLPLFVDNPNVAAIGINCTPPQFVPGLLETIGTLSRNKKLLVYPNSGETYHAHTKTWSGESSPHNCKVMAEEWLSLGADIIGGCCRMGPAHIKAMKKAI